MKKMFVAVMTTAAMISAASATASACCNCDHAEYDPNASANVRVTVRLTKEQLNGDACWDQTVSVPDADKDGYLTYADAVTAAYYAYNPTATGSAIESGTVWGQQGRYKIYITDANGTEVLGGNVEGGSYYTLRDGLWVHVEPYILEFDVYEMDWISYSGLTDYVPLNSQGATVELRTVKYPAGDFRPVPAAFTELLIDGQPTGMMTDANGLAMIVLNQEPGSHKMTANFPTKDENAAFGEYIYWIEDPEWVQNEQTMKWQTAAFANELNANAEGTVAAETTAPAVTTDAAETAVLTTAAPAETTAAITDPAETAAATTAATTVSAKQTSATGTTKAGSLKTGDSTPVAALIIAGLAAAGTAIAFSRRRKAD